MAVLNRFELIGVLTKEPQEKENSGPAQKRQCLVTLAVNGSRYNTTTGRHEPCTRYFPNLGLWDTLADYALKNLTKGATVLVEGYLDTDPFTETVHIETNGVVSPVVRKRNPILLRVSKLQLLRSPAVNPSEGASGDPF
jgi:single-stranded DNA-binding protein